MPIYEFRCQDCGKHFEALLFPAEPLETISCTQCGSSKIVKEISTASFRLGTAGGVSSGPSSGCASRGGFS